MSNPITNVEILDRAGKLSVIFMEALGFDRDTRAGNVVELAEVVGGISITVNGEYWLMVNHNIPERIIMYKGIGPRELNTIIYANLVDEMLFEETQLVTRNS